MSFIQVIEIKTSRPEEIEALTDEWAAKTEGQRKARRATFTMDRDRPGTYLQIVEFNGYAEAMENSQLPVTSEFAERLAKLCDAPPVFRNLDVRSVQEL